MIRVERWRSGRNCDKGGCGVWGEIVIRVGGWRLGRNCDKGGKVAFGAKL